MKRSISRSERQKRMLVGGQGWRVSLVDRAEGVGGVAAQQGLAVAQAQDRRLVPERVARRGDQPHRPVAEEVDAVGEGRERGDRLVLVVDRPPVEGVVEHARPVALEDVAVGGRPPTRADRPRTSPQATPRRRSRGRSAGGSSRPRRRRPGSTPRPATWARSASSRSMRIRLINDPSRPRLAPGSSATLGWMPVSTRIGPRARMLDEERGDRQCDELRSPGGERPRPGEPAGMPVDQRRRGDHLRGLDGVEAHRRALAPSRQRELDRPRLGPTLTPRTLPSRMLPQPWPSRRPHPSAPACSKPRRSRSPRRRDVREGPWPSLTRALGARVGRSTPPTCSTEPAVGQALAGAAGRAGGYERRRGRRRRALRGRHARRAGWRLDRRPRRRDRRDDRGAGWRQDRPDRPLGGRRRARRGRARGSRTLARTLSIEWARHQVRTTAVAPGARRARQDVAALVAYLASPAALLLGLPVRAGRKAWLHSAQGTSTTSSCGESRATTYSAGSGLREVFDDVGLAWRDVDEVAGLEVERLLGWVEQAGASGYPST